MNSSFLCVIVIGLLFQVFAQDLFHSQLWRKNLEKISKEHKGSKDRFHSELWRANLKKITEEYGGSALEEHSPSPRPPEETKAHLVCADKTDVSRDTILSIKKGNWKDVDPNAKDWVKCVLMETNLMTDQSVFRQDVAFKYWSGVDKKLLEENIDMCLPNKTMPPVDISWEFAKCFQTADPWSSLF